MPEMQNDRIRLTIADDAGRVIVEDRKRGCAWTLLASRGSFRRYPPGKENAYPGAASGGAASARTPLAGGKVEQRAGVIEVRYDLPDGTITYRWKLAGDHVEVTLQAGGDAIEYIALPGAFVPVEGPHQIAVPVYQGVLCRGTDHEWEKTVEAGGHTHFSMAMAAVIGEKGALLVTQESLTDWAATHGQEQAGPFFVFEQRRCAVDGWYERTVRLYPVDADITAIGKRYRARVQERGEFVGWEEKIARKPIVQNLFGALIAFIGYNKTDQIDYVDSARRLKACGFERVLYYPARLCHYSLDFKMGGDEPIWLPDEQIQALKAIDGALLSPWAWIYEGLDDGSEARHGIFTRGPGGELIPHWKIDEFQWYEVCTPYQVEHMKRRFATDLAAMDWVHFDVNAMRPGRCCFATSHAPHAKQPMGRRADLEWTRRLFSQETVGNRIVSSEGFVDRYAAYYDIGSTKIYPQWGDRPFIPVPLTMLVFHDSVVHDWWEVHNYNAHAGFSDDKDQGVGVNGAGRPEQKAAMDALYGCPPNLFPFGKQYSWVNIETRESYSYVVRLDDTEVQRAIRAALPVCRLHQKIGKCELVSFEFLTEDHAVQSTVFSDGTRVVANIADEDKETAEFGAIAANRWLQID